MPLIKKKFVSTNNIPVEYFHAENSGFSDVHIIWFSAFTHGPLLGKILKTEQRFHGFKLASNNPNFSFTLIRDPSGLTNDGTYYYGDSNDAYVEESLFELISEISKNLRIQNPSIKIFALGSSMGAYGAAKFAILNNLDAVIALIPHFDLKVARELCGRKLWIDWVTEKSDEVQRLKYLNRLQSIVIESTDDLPVMFIQSAEDDYGVHTEQVLPFVKLYRDNGGNVIEDFRTTGGHSMTNASNEYISSVIQLLESNSNFQKGMFNGYPSRVPTRAEILERNFAKIESFLAKALIKLGIRK